MGSTPTGKLEKELLLNEKEIASLKKELKQYIKSLGRLLDQDTKRDALGLAKGFLDAGSPCRGLKFWPSKRRRLDYTEHKEQLQEMVARFLEQIIGNRRSRIHSVSKTPGRSSRTTESAAVKSIEDTQAYDLDDTTIAAVEAAMAKADAKDPSFQAPKSDYVEDTTRQTRRRALNNPTVPKSSTASDATEVPSYERPLEVYTGEISSKAGLSRAKQGLQSHERDATLTADLSPRPQTPTNMGKGKRKADDYEADWLDDLPDTRDILTPPTTTRQRAASTQNVSNTDNRSAAKAPRLRAQAGPSSPAEILPPAQSSLFQYFSQSSSSTSGATVNPTPLSPRLSPTSPALSTSHRNPEHSTPAPTLIRAGLCLYTPENLAKLPDLLLNHLRACEQAYTKAAEEATDEDKRRGHSETAQLIQDMWSDLNSRARSLAYDAKSNHVSNLCL